MAVFSSWSVLVNSAREFSAFSVILSFQENGFVIGSKCCSVFVTMNSESRFSSFSLRCLTVFLNLNNTVFFVVVVVLNPSEILSVNPYFAYWFNRT